jgi:ATP-dependent Clp protease ATP-binding subunit ClpA
VFEDGQLSDGLGNTVDFRNTIIIMTSNLGARHLQYIVAGVRRRPVERRPRQYG